jgi:hypothetical protein
MRSRTTIVATVASALLLAGLSTPSGATASPFGTKTPVEILSLVSSAVTSSKGVRATEILSYPNLSIKITTDGAKTEGTQVIRENGGSETNRLLGTQLFVRANKNGYVQIFGIYDSPLAGKWALVPSSNKNYSYVANGLTLTSIATNVVKMVDPKNLGIRNFEGTPAVAIQGQVPDGTTGDVDVQTVFIATTAPYLLLGLYQKFVVSSEPGEESIHFSRWGESVQIAKPASFVTATSKTFP